VDTRPSGHPLVGKGWWQMTCMLRAAWDEQLTDYHFGRITRLAPVRVELIMRLAHEFGRGRRRPLPGSVAACRA
jgi:hypothetical protein